MQGQIIDFDTTVPIAFAKISYNNKTITSNWEGKFTIQIVSDNKPLVCSYKGYYDKNYYLTEGVKFLLIKMVTNDTLKEQEIYSENQVNLLVKKVIDSKHKNQPEKVLKSFQYKNYEQLLVSANPDSITSKIDTIVKKRLFGGKKIKLDSSNYRYKKFIEKQHLYQIEKVNIIQHNEKGTKETVVATRMSGLKQLVYDYLGLKLISYSVYDNPIQIIEIPIINPLSNVGRKMYVFKLIDTLKIQNRTVYRVYFQPKKLNSNRLRGLLYIDAESHAVAKAFYRIYGVVNINATYSFNYMKEHGIWFPEKRSFNVVKGNNSEDIKILGGTIKFNSTSKERLKVDASDQTYIKIESVPYDIEINKPVTFTDPKIKMEVVEDIMNKPESYWKFFKKDTVDVRKIPTYAKLDSISRVENIEQKLVFGKKIINGYAPFKIFDIDLRSVVKYNNYEGFRLGIGGVTNAKLSSQYRIGFFGAYGLKDNGFKFGVTPAYLLDKKTNSWVSVSYTDDLSEIGQIQFATQQKRFKIYDPRPINISTFYNFKTYSSFIESKIIPKLDVYFAISKSQIQPLFDYTFVVDDEMYTKFDMTTAQLSLQWNPFSGYMQTASGRIEFEKRFPKFSLQYTKSIPKFLGNDFGFSKIDFKIAHEIPYLSGQNTSFIFQAGIATGDIPITHLYSIAPNNLNRDALLQRITFAGKNSFETMYFNEFFSNNYVSFQARHTFNRVKVAYKVKPEFSVVTRMAWGNMDKPEQHFGFEYKTLDKGFFESGVEINQIYKGLGFTFFYRYGPNGLSRFEDNLALKISYVLNLGI
ncbi:MAG: DUF5686 family protein [Bacteroidota bacterium]